MSFTRGGVTYSSQGEYRRELAKSRGFDSRAASVKAAKDVSGSRHFKQDLKAAREIAKDKGQAFDKTKFTSDYTKVNFDKSGERIARNQRDRETFVKYLEDYGFTSAADTAKRGSPKGGKSKGS